MNILNDNFNNVLTAVAILESHTSNIKNNVFNDCKYGIVSKPSPHEINSSDSLFIVNCSFKKISNLLASPNGIFITNVDTEFTYLKIDSCAFEGCANSISLNKFDHCSPIISNCTITNYESYGISLTNGSSVIINGNNISTSNSAAVDPIGIYLSQVTNPYILEDTITTDLSNPGSGIVSVSSSGYYRSNIISGYYNGVELGNSSSPDMALNEIYHNINYGIFISTGSNPKLNKLTSGDSHYPLAGYNAIYENGESTELSDDPEIYINTANIQLSKGCNTIADDRYIAPPYDHKILMDGQNVRYKITADSNYWGDHPIYGYNPAQRFGNQITVKYAPYDTVPCTYSPDNSRMLVLTTTTGEVADTVYSDGTLAGQLSSIQSNYASANQYFYSRNYNDAENTYKQIINLSEDSTYSIEAYNKLYLIKKYQNANLQGYENLRQYYQGKLPSIEDTSILLVVNNLMDMCRVSKDEYEQAIASFDETAQNNQGTDIELYNEINALTTSLLVDTTSGLGKANLSKYKSRDISEYLKNVNEVLKSRRKNVESDKNKLIPAKYILYQNYPNPFNPTTTIKYAVPKSVNVELKIFDILGREVKTLINETRNPGYYEVQFNASNLASGIYFYRLRAGDYIKTSKMLLVK